MMSYTAIETLGYVATGVSLAASLTSSYVREQKMKATVREEVKKEFEANKSKEDESK